MNHPDESLSTASDSASWRSLNAGWWLACTTGAGLILALEHERLGGLLTGAVADALAGFNIDTTPSLFLFLLLPLAWWFRSPLLARPPRAWSVVRSWLARSGRQSGWFSVLLLLLITGATAAALQQRAAMTPVRPDTDLRFRDLPPAFHDEFSYRFQARTFAAGRWSYPSHSAVPRLFDQMHVLNEGRFVSRYFPGAGAWFAVFLKVGDIRTGPLAATVLITLFVTLIGRELSTNGIGLLAGLLCAAAPGLNLFGNTLLAHQPTLAGLGLFLYSVLRLQRGLQEPEPEGVLRWSLLAGAGLSFAMLCRPMTAAGVGLPFGVWLLIWLIRNRHRRGAVLRCTSGFAIPLAVGFGVLLIHNLETTGQWLKSPYGLYTELFTPRHQFGFNNVVRAEKNLGPRVLDHYDRWAENLDARLAVKNVGVRFLASWQWTQGVIALVMSVLLVIGGAKQQDRRWLWIGAAILSLHLVHVPYWYDGILHWHYVFESGPLWCLLAAAATALVVMLAKQWDRPWLSIWWLALLLSSVLVNQLALPPFWETSRLEAGLHEFAFAKLRHEHLRQLIEQQVTERPALVLIRHDPDDRHIDYVDNPPDLQSDVLTGRLPMDRSSDEEQTLRAVRIAFPDRALYVFDARSGRIARITR